MCFRTYLEAGGRYSQHKHNCQEITKVIKGHLIELLDNNKIYEVGQTVIYDSATMHEPYCTIESEYDVTLCYNLKPRKNENRNFRRKF
jgi:anti-sigma factor ChrR (cupin superfamily)